MSGTYIDSDTLKAIYAKFLSFVQGTVTVLELDEPAMGNDPRPAREAVQVLLDNVEKGQFWDCYREERALMWSAHEALNAAGYTSLANKLYELFDAWDTGVTDNSRCAHCGRIGGH